MSAIYEIQGLSNSDPMEPVPRNFSAKIPLPLSPSTHPPSAPPSISVHATSTANFRRRTHDSTYTLYRLGERLSTGLRLYVETGRTDGLDADGDSPNSLHSFTGPPVPQGEGTSVARAFLDGNHTLISIMARINPSPDWFVGVDSFQLCVEGNWVDTVTVELDPLDGGTDNGFTFTAANWPTQPQGIAYRITSRYPAHPAGSFYYPNLPRLPPIATLTFTKHPNLRQDLLGSLGDESPSRPQDETQQRPFLFLSILPAPPLQPIATTSTGRTPIET
ncbi:Spondin-2 [Eufriesea mexicana]|uniref:Spondin-2 n=1 Tax=Eufriesea mexicana TaxID=516756 RepID=A0A310SPZ0_9HYME|nr:Spondin-2 [Eufriesea mexicana]